MTSGERTQYYQVLFDYNATPTIEVVRASQGLDHSLIIDGKPIDARTPVRFVMPKGTPVDYQQNDLGWRLCSPRMRGIIDTHKSKIDVVEWIDALITAERSKEQRYFVVHFPSPLPLAVLDRRRTVFNPSNPRLVVKPALNHQAVDGHNVFTYEGGFEPWFVSQRVRDALLAAGCEKIEFVERSTSSFLSETKCRFFHITPTYL
jgi:hypothetical protein